MEISSLMMSCELLSKKARDDGSELICFVWNLLLN